MLPRGTCNVNCSEGGGVDVVVVVLCANDEAFGFPPIHDMCVSKWDVY